jgi:DNA-directed RNA polymerase specialized sigma24 family protein
MSSVASVTHWIRALKDGDAAAAQPLWERYFRRLVGLARKKLRSARRREADEDDVALSAFDSFCRGAMQGRFPQLADRDDLWRLLMVITARKALDLLTRQGTLKSGGGKVRGESALLDAADGTGGGIGAVVGRGPTPEEVAILAEQLERLLDKLGDDELRTIAVWKMEGFTNEEIRKKLDCAPATVERRLKLIRKRWKGESVP